MYSDMHDSHFLRLGGNNFPVPHPMSSTGVQMGGRQKSRFGSDFDDVIPTEAKRSGGTLCSAKSAAGPSPRRLLILIN